MKKTVDCIELRRISYDDAFAVQARLHGQIWQGQRREAVLFQENERVITMGIGADAGHLLSTPAELKSAGIALKHTGRGGDITYHGPGQMVVSPILRLRDYAPTALGYVRALEDSVIRLLDGYGVSARRIDGMTGVWVGREKIAAIGVAVSHSVTMHGFALNINTELEYFDRIIPCGLKGMGVTSLERLGVDLSWNEVRHGWLGIFSEMFNIEFSFSEVEE